MMRRARVGFTLMELMIVLVILALTAAAAVPAFLLNDTSTPERQVASSLAEALIRARDASRTSGASTSLVLAPRTGHFWISTRDSSAEGTLPLPTGVALVDGDGERVTCRFEASGQASPCKIGVRGASSVMVSVDGWSGDVRIADARAR